MADKDNAQNVIESYRKRQQAAKRAPLFLGVVALLLIAGIVAVIIFLNNSGGGALSFLATDTPTVTVTSTPTSTATSTSTTTVTATSTETPTATSSPTPTGPFVYEVVEGDTLYGIAVKFGVDLGALLAVNAIDPTNPRLDIGTKLTIPGPDTPPLPTTTPYPLSVPSGTTVEYIVEVGDTLGIIAANFNSTIEAILEENDLENANEIFPGDTLIIPVNLVTPIPTATPGTATVTPTGGARATSALTASATASVTANTTPTP